MGNISIGTVMTLSDSIAKHIADLQTLTGGSQTSIVSGQATTLGEIAALNDAAQQYLLLDSFQASINAESAFLSNLSLYANIIALFRPACVALDTGVGGLQAFLAAHQPNQVAPAFLDAFNAAMKSLSKANLSLLPWVSFSPAISNMGQLNVSGANTGSFVAGTANTNYGNNALSIKNVGSGATGGSNGTYTVTYNKYDGSGNLLTGQTATATMPGSSAQNTLVALSGSAAGIAVTNITVSGGNASDQIAVVSAVPRTPAY